MKINLAVYDNKGFPLVDYDARIYPGLGGAERPSLIGGLMEEVLGSVVALMDTPDRLTERMKTEAPNNKEREESDPSNNRYIFENAGNYTIILRKNYLNYNVTVAAEVSKKDLKKEKDPETRAKITDQTFMKEGIFALIDYVTDIDALIKAQRAASVAKMKDDTMRAKREAEARGDGDPSEIFFSKGQYSINRFDLFN